MQLSQEDIELIKIHNIQFISIKYIDHDETLKQLDLSITKVQNNYLLYLANHLPMLKPIGKSFLDPFRSLPTLSIFCEYIDDNNKQKYAILKQQIQEHNDHSDLLSFRVIFTINDSDLNQQDISLNAQYKAYKNDYTMAITPLDQFSNLRSEVVQILQKININAICHFHGSTIQESVIELEGNNINDLIYDIIITKFIVINVANSYGLDLPSFHNNTM